MPTIIGYLVRITYASLSALSNNGKHIDVRAIRIFERKIAKVTKGLGKGNSIANKEMHFIYWAVKNGNAIVNFHSLPFDNNVIKKQIWVNGKHLQFYLCTFPGTAMCTFSHQRLNYSKESHFLYKFHFDCKIVEMHVILFIHFLFFFIFSSFFPFETKYVI